MQFAVGIDVAGEKRGHHGVALELGSGKLAECWAWPNERAVLKDLPRLEGLRAVAIDAPPSARRLGPAVREAEKELNTKGVNPQWTPAPGGRAQPWMENGERLWRCLRVGLQIVPLIGAFLTATVKLGQQALDIAMPLEFVRRVGFKDRKDELDATIAAWVAAAWLVGKALCAGRGSPDNETWN